MIEHVHEHYNRVIGDYPKSNAHGQIDSSEKENSNRKQIN
jgi:hypothetical protein